MEANDWFGVKFVSKKQVKIVNYGMLPELFRTEYGYFYQWCPRLWYTADNKEKNVCSIQFNF